MNTIWLILIMMLVGALIGGFTNFIAIRMLFRPHRAIYIGRWKLPFTPGLIPKRHNELASQVGKIVVNHLLTPESIQKKLNNHEFKVSLRQLIIQKVNGWIDTGVTLEQILEKLGINEPTDQTRDFIRKKLKQKYNEVKNEYNTKQLNEVLPKEWFVVFEAKIPEVAEQVTNRAATHFSGDEGKEKIKQLLENFLQERGKMWNMIQMFIGQDSLVERLQPELVKFFNHPGTNQMVVNLLSVEMQKLEQKQVIEFTNKLDDEKMLNQIDEWMEQLIPYHAFFHQPLSTIIEPYRESIEVKMIPMILDVAGEYIVTHMEEMLNRFQVEEIVREQIEAFSLKTLEEIVISIAKKELVMITYLGALLGGLIGIIQGLLVVLMT